MEYSCAAVKHGGVAYLTVPNYGSWPIRLRLVQGRLVDPPGHCNYFTAKTLRNLFMQKGLREEIAQVRVRSYGIPEIHAVYRCFSKNIPSTVKTGQSHKPKRAFLKKALINIYYWSGIPFGFGDKLEARIVKKIVLCRIRRLTPIVIITCALVISTVGPQSGPKWRNLFKKDFSTPLRYARNDTSKRIDYS